MGAYNGARVGAKMMQGAGQALARVRGRLCTTPCWPGGASNACCVAADPIRQRCPACACRGSQGRWGSRPLPAWTSWRETCQAAWWTTLTGKRLQPLPNTRMCSHQKLHTKTQNCASACACFFLYVSNPSHSAPARPRLCPALSARCSMSHVAPGTWCTWCVFSFWCLTCSRWRTPYDGPDTHLELLSCW